MDPGYESKKYLFLETAYGEDNKLEYLHFGTQLVYLLSRNSNFCILTWERLTWSDQNIIPILNELVNK